MAAKKTRWSILVLEDNADLRETLRSNFAELCGEALHVDFAASICHAMDKIKTQMRNGDPYDAFWIDLYLDYFSYDDELGEIVTVDSFSQIIDTEVFLQHNSLTTFSLPGLLQKLQIDFLSDNKSPQEFTSVEKFRVLKKFQPYCLPVAQSTYDTFLETCERFQRGADALSAELNEANLYARYALDFVFRQFLQWASSPREREFSPFDEPKPSGSESLNVSILPERHAKSDQSWTIFHTWVQQFYNAVAMGSAGFEDYASTNLLLREIKRIDSNGYPQFLVNTAYQGRRQELVHATAISPAENVIVANNKFKGDKKDKDFLDHLFRVCRRLRRPYLLLKHHRRGAGAYLISTNDLFNTVEELPRARLPEPIAVDDKLRTAFTRKTFYPELTANFNKLSAAVPREFVTQLLEKAVQDLQNDAKARQSSVIHLQSFCIPESFLNSSTRRDPFHVVISTGTGANLPERLSFDEGRWLFLDLTCRRWFPKCFYMHSNWTAREDDSKRKSYFFPTQQVLNRALITAAARHEDLFPELKHKEIVLPITSSFFDAASEYSSAFDWEVFFVSTFGPLDTGSANSTLQAKRLLLVLRYVLSELQIRRIASKLITKTMLTPATLCQMLETSEAVAVEEALRHCGNQIEHANTTLLIEKEYLPGIKTALAVLLCFYTLPSTELGTLYRFWESKKLPPNKTRPTEKFTAINKRLGNVKFTHSAYLPAQTEGKSKFIYIPPAIIAPSSHEDLSLREPPEKGRACSEQSFDYMSLTYEEFFKRLEHFDEQVR